MIGPDDLAYFAKLPSHTRALLATAVTDEWITSKKRREDRKWVPSFCASCHSDSAFMRQFDPDLPTDQFDKYKESRHGMTLLAGKNPRAAECTSCHGVHGIQGPSSPGSHVVRAGR